MERKGLHKIEDLQNGALANANVSFCTREHFGRAQADESDYYIRLAYSGISVEDINEGLIKLKDFFVINHIFCACFSCNKIFRQIYVFY